MLTATQTTVLNRNAIDAAVARARHERDAELGRLIGLGFAAMRAAVTRLTQRAVAAVHAVSIGNNAHHA
jgi:hypothetical protein